MIEALLRGVVLFPVRVFSGFLIKRWSDGAETVPWKNTGKSMDCLICDCLVRTILDSGDLKTGRS
jgi:hypothetical protein